MGEFESGDIVRYVGPAGEYSSGLGIVEGRTYGIEYRVYFPSMPESWDWVWCHPRELELVRRGKGTRILELLPLLEFEAEKHRSIYRSITDSRYEEEEKHLEKLIEELGEDLDWRSQDRLGDVLAQIGVPSTFTHSSVTPLKLTVALGLGGKHRQLKRKLGKALKEEEVE